MNFGLAFLPEHRVTYLYLCITVTHSMVRKLQGLRNGLLWELFAFFFIPSVPSDL